MKNSSKIGGKNIKTNFDEKCIDILIHSLDQSDSNEIKGLETDKK